MSRAFERCLSFFSTATRSRDHGGAFKRPPPPAGGGKSRGPAGRGLNAANIHAIYKAMRISCVGKIVINRDMTFAKVLEDRCQINICDITHINYGRKWISSMSITEFYKEMLQWFREAVPKNTRMWQSCAKTDYMV